MSVNTRLDGRAVRLAREIEERRPTVTPADLLLLTIPALLLAGLFAAWLSALSMHAALFLACLPALMATGYALFYDPPVSSDREN